MHWFNQIISVRLQFFLIVLAVAAFAVNSAELSSPASEKAALFEALAAAESEQEGKITENAIWQYWFNQAPSPDVRQALDAGIKRREAYDFEAAEAHLDNVVALAPDYAEGYNQRAFVRFLRENYDDAQGDLEMALELEPDHFGAMSGLFHILQKQSRQKAAHSLLQQALGIHPWLKERHALPEALWPESYRDIHQSGQEI